MIVFACFLQKLNPSKSFYKSFANELGLAVNELSRFLQIYRFADTFRKTLVYSIKDVSVYILYFIRIFYKFTKVVLFQLTFKELRFVKGLADVL